MIEEVLAQAFVAHPGGLLFGIGFIILSFYFGLGILFNGWPRFGRRK